MTIKVTYRSGVFEPVEDLTNVPPGQNFEFWNNPDDAVYDNLWPIPDPLQRQDQPGKLRR